MRTSLLGGLLFVFGLTGCVNGPRLFAQQHLSVPRADGRSTPLLVYSAAGARATCAPLAVISHGAGGSENGYRYLAQAMAGLG